MAVLAALLLPFGGSALAHGTGADRGAAFEKGSIPGYGMTRARTDAGTYKMRIGERMVEFDEHAEADRAMAATSHSFDLSTVAAAPPECAASGRRMIAVYAHPAGAPNNLAGKVGAIRSSIAKTNGKLFAESLISSAGQRTASLKFQCDGSGAVDVVPVSIPAECEGFGDPGYQPGYCHPHYAGHVAWAVEQQLGLPQGSNAVKYLIFFDKPYTGFTGVAFNFYSNDEKDAANPNRTETTSAVVYPEIWNKLTVLHEVGHLFGAVQLSAPHSSGAYHCDDGNDVMCYFDNPESNFTDRICPVGVANVVGDLFDSALGMPFDCGYDDFFRTVSGDPYLDSHWNAGGAENDLLRFTPGWSTTTPTDPGVGNPVTEAEPDLRLVSRQSGRLAKEALRRTQFEITNGGAGPTRGPTTAVLDLDGPARLRSAGGPGWQCSRERLSSLCTFDGSISPGETATLRVETRIRPRQRGSLAAGVFSAGDTELADNSVVIRLGRRN